MTKILIKVGFTGVASVYSDSPDVEVVVDDIDSVFFGPPLFKNGVSVEDFAATQHKVWGYE